MPGFRYDDMFFPMAENQANLMLDQVWYLNHEAMRFIDIVKCVTTTTPAEGQAKTTQSKNGECSRSQRQDDRANHQRVPLVHAAEGQGHRRPAVRPRGLGPDAAELRAMTSPFAHDRAMINAQLA